MNIQISNLKKTFTYLSFFFPELNFNQKELSQSGSEKLINYLVLIIDALIKSENLHNKRNLHLGEDRSFFAHNPVHIMENINSYLSKFSSRIFNFSRTECQTFIFVLENLIDYYKNVNLYVSEKDKSSYFTDYRFWIENFFKIFDQKITGAVFSNEKMKRVNNILDPNNQAENNVVFSNSSTSFSLFPFMIEREKQNLFLHRVTENALVYRYIQKEKDILIKDSYSDQRVFEFLISNFDFKSANFLKKRVDDGKNIILKNCDQIEAAFNFQREKLFTESYNILKEIS